MRPTLWSRRAHDGMLRYHLETSPTAAGPMHRDVHPRDYTGLMDRVGIEAPSRGTHLSYPVDGCLTRLLRDTRLQLDIDAAATLLQAPDAETLPRSSRSSPSDGIKGPRGSSQALILMDFRAKLISTQG